MGGPQSEDVDGLGDSWDVDGFGDSDGVDGVVDDGVEDVLSPVFAASLSASLAAALADALVLAPEPPRSFLAQPVPLKWTAGAANCLRIVASAPHEGQNLGPGSLIPWRMSAR
jgi:hypothetical protein